MLLTLQLYLLFGTESEVHTIRQLIRIISGKEIKHHLVAQWGLKFQVHQKPTTIYNTKCNMTKIRLLNKGYLVWEHHSKRRLVLKWYLNSSHFDCCLNTFTYTIKTTYQLNSRIFKSPLYLRKKLGRKKKDCEYLALVEETSTETRRPGRCRRISSLEENPFGKNVMPLHGPSLELLGNPIRNF